MATSLKYASVDIIRSTLHRIDSNMELCRDSARDMYCLAYVIKRMREIRDLKIRNDSIKDEMYTCKQNIETLNQKLASLHWYKFAGPIFLVMIPILILLGWLIAQSIVIGVFSGLCGTITGILTPYFREKRQIKKEIDHWTGIYDELIQEGSDVIDEINDIMADIVFKHAKEIIPDQYLELNILAQFEMDIMDRKAFTLKEAIENYESRRRKEEGTM